MIQSKATPSRPRPVSSDLSLTFCVAVQRAPQPTVKVLSCPDHWPSISPPNTNIPACQLKPTWPPASPPFRLPEPITLVALNSVGPVDTIAPGTGLIKTAPVRGSNRTRLVVRPPSAGLVPANLIFELCCPHPYPAFT